MFTLSIEKKEEYKAKVAKAIEPLANIGSVAMGITTEFKKEVQKHKDDRITLTVLGEFEEVARVTIKERQLEMLNKALDDVKAIRSSYLAECNQGVNTIDPVDVAITIEELKLMNDEELVDFYGKNMGDNNKIRLFKLECKSRSLSNPGFEEFIDTLIEQRIKKDSLMQFVEMVESDLNRYINDAKNNTVFTGLMLLKEHPKLPIDYLNMGDFMDINQLFNEAKNQVYYGNNLS